jgi:TldD protein
MKRCVCLLSIYGLGFVLLCQTSQARSPAPPPTQTDDVIMQALETELARAMTLQMEDLEKPYFIQFSVSDALAHQISASYGAVTSSDGRRERAIYTQVRVGSYESDNTNFAGDGGFFFGRSGGAGGVRSSLPLDNDPVALRQAIWLAADADYKNAVETLTKKRAYMKDKKIEDRPADYTSAPVERYFEPPADLHFDQNKWEGYLEQISARFKKHKAIQDSSVQLLAGIGNGYIVNSEGTRVRTAERGAVLIISAELQADDGMKLSDSRSYAAESADDLPQMDRVAADLDEMVADLLLLKDAPILEDYTGPVLFDALAAGQMFRQMLAEGVAGKIEPVGTQRRVFEGAENLEKKLDQLVLPKTFRVFDDPTVKTFGKFYLFGHFLYDDEGVKTRRVNIVEKGVLKDLVMSRTPTKKRSESNGHGRRPPGGGSVGAAIGVLFIESGEGVSAEEMKATLIEAAQEAGLEFGIRVRALRTAGLGASRSDLLSMIMRMQRGRGSSLGDPVYAYKVYVEDGREELVRGIEFGETTHRSLRKISAAGDTPAVYNYIGLGFGGATPPTSIIAPSVLFEELELSKIEQEHDTLPILEPPVSRRPTEKR